MDKVMNESECYIKGEENYMEKRHRDAKEIPSIRSEGVLPRRRNSDTRSGIEVKHTQTGGHSTATWKPLPQSTQEEQTYYVFAFFKGFC